jgi:VWFA-related protein
MSRRPVLTLLALLVFSAFPGAQQSTPSDARRRNVYVSVVDSAGAPVQGLTAADFTVREDSAAREVLSAGPATTPMQLALLIDDSQASSAAIPQIREGVNAFIDALAGKAEIAVITIGERPTINTEYTTSADVLKRGVAKIFSHMGSGAYLLEGVVDASRGLEKRKAERPVIVVLTFEGGPEFSNLTHDRVLEQLQRSGATLHVLAVGTPANSLSEEMRNRNVVIAEGTARTGGRRDQLLAESAIPNRFKQLADELTHQYVVTYGRPETLIPPERISVGVSKPGLTVRARTRISGK